MVMNYYFRTSLSFLLYNFETEFHLFSVVAVGSFMDDEILLRVQYCRAGGSGVQLVKLVLELELDLRSENSEMAILSYTTYSRMTP